MAAASNRTIIRVNNADALAATCAEHILARIRANMDRPSVCLSGGSGPTQLFKLLCEPSFSARIPWHRVHWFIGDERFVPESDPRNNMAAARRALLDRHAPPELVHTIPTNLADPDAAARAYEADLKTFYRREVLDPARPLFDVVLLGIGPDGHTASLFPGAPGLLEQKRWVIGVDKAHVEPFVPRVSLTLPALASCREMLFLAGGESKRDIIARMMAGEDLPAARANSNEETVWLVDTAAMPEPRHG